MNLKRYAAGVYRVGNVLIKHGSDGWNVMHGGALSAYRNNNSWMDSVIDRFVKGLNDNWIPYVYVNTFDTLRECRDFINWEL